MAFPISRRPRTRRRTRPRRAISRPTRRSTEVRSRSRRARARTGRRRRTGACLRKVGQTFRLRSISAVRRWTRLCPARRTAVAEVGSLLCRSYRLRSRAAVTSDKIRCIRRCRPWGCNNNNKDGVSRTRPSRPRGPRLTRSKSSSNSSSSSISSISSSIISNSNSKNMPT